MVAGRTTARFALRILPRDNPLVLDFSPLVLDFFTPLRLNEYGSALYLNPDAQKHPLCVSEIS